LFSLSTAALGGAKLCWPGSSGPNGVTDWMFVGSDWLMLLLAGYVMGACLSIMIADKFERKYQFVIAALPQ
jgi:hypothetical protein